MCMLVTPTCPTKGPIGLTVVAPSSACTTTRIIGAMAEITARNPYRSMKNPCAVPEWARLGQGRAGWARVG